MGNCIDLISTIKELESMQPELSSIGEYRKANMLDFAVGYLNKYRKSLAEKRRTGIKDKCGKEISEGDVLIFHHKIYTNCSRTKIEFLEKKIVKMVWLKSMWVLADTKEEGRYYMFLPDVVERMQNDLELICSEYENPELSL